MVVLQETTIYYLCMSTIRQFIKDNIYENTERSITGTILQEVLLKMVDRDVFLTEEEYGALVDAGLVDPDKIYHIYEEE